MVDISEAIKAANLRLKMGTDRVTIEKRYDRLYLRATLPPKPDSEKVKNHQQNVKIEAYANPPGLKRAISEAKRLSSDIGLGRFDWRNWGHKAKAEKLTVRQWVEAFEKNYFNERERNGKSETTWDKDYRLPFAKLPQDSLLSADALFKLIEEKQPDSRPRQRFVDAYGQLAKFAKLDIDTERLRRLRGNYSPKSVNLRDLPSDEMIVEFRETIPDPSWQWVYGMIAAYGLRPHEAFLLVDQESIKKSPLILVDGKTGIHPCLPVMPDWWQDWELSNVKIPQVTATQNRHYGDRTGQYFRRLKMPFKVYDIRHAWAARAAKLGLPDTIAAKLQGHSPQVHNRIYQQFMQNADLVYAWEFMQRRISQLSEGADV